MKTSIKIFTVVCLAVLCVIPFFTVFAKANDYSLKQTEGFTVAYSDSDLSKAASIIGISEKELKARIKEDNILFIAVNGDNSAQIRLSRYETSLSREMDDISSLSDNLLLELFDGISDNDFVKTSINGTVFIKVEETLADEGGKYTSEQYITVKNGCVYQISVYIGEKADKEQTAAFVNSIRIIGATIYSNKQKFLVAAGIAAFIILIAVMTRGIIKDIREG